MATSDEAIVVEAGGRTRRVGLHEYLTADLAEQAERAAYRWIKSLRAIPIDGQVLRDRFTLRGDSLWWFAELYLHKTQVINKIFRTLLALDALVSREQPTRLAVERGDVALTLLARQVAAREGIRWGGGAAFGGRSRWWTQAALDGRARAYRAGAWLARRSRTDGRRRAKVRIAGFVHAAFWREEEEQYIGPILDRLFASLPAGELALVGLGPRTSYRARTWRQRVSEFGGRAAAGARLEPIDDFAGPADVGPSRDVWRHRASVFSALCGSQPLRNAAVIRQCDVWPLVEPVLAGIAYLQFPWSAYVMDQLGASLDVLRPAAVVTYAEAGGWGRALVLEARRRAIPSVGLQHGFIYRHWLNYLHEPDEMQPSPDNPADMGFPYPTVTLLYDEFAAEHLRTAGGFPPEAVAVTGSARLDTLVTRASRLTSDDIEHVRHIAGARPGQHLVLVAAKFTQIRPVFRRLVEAVATMPDVHVVVKCHPAESGAPYLAMAAGVPNVTVAPGSADLAALTRAARLLVTVNSTAAIEAMVMGVPALGLALPSNLSPFVDAGAMAGVNDGEDLVPTLRALLADGERRESLDRGRAAFLARYGIRSDGQAAARAAAHVLRVAGGTAPDAIC